MLALVNRGTFDSATGGTFQSDTDGTFHSDILGTFESDMDGTFKVLQSDKVITLCVVLLWCVICCLIVDVALYTEFYDFVQYNIPVGIQGDKV